MSTKWYVEVKDPLVTAEGMNSGERSRAGGNIRRGIALLGPSDKRTRLIGHIEDTTREEEEVMARGGMARGGIAIRGGQVAYRRRSVV